jgi:hypothetical protein
MAKIGEAAATTERKRQQRKTIRLNVRTETIPAKTIRLSVRTKSIPLVSKKALEGNREKRKDGKRSSNEQGRY